MQALFIISIFTMVLTLIGGMITSGSSSSAQLTRQRIAETESFFEQVAKVTLNDITLENMEANPKGATNVADFIRGIPQLKQLSSGRYADPALDAWGKPVQGYIVKEYLSLNTAADPNNRISVPVTGFVLVSGGPDGNIQTDITTSRTQLSQLYGVVPPSGSDDIVYRFDDRDTQQQAMTILRSHVDRIGIAALKELQGRSATYRTQKLQQYRDAIAAGQDVNVATIDLDTAPDAPTFYPLDNSATGQANRRKLGVDEDFAIIERLLPSNGRLKLDASSSGPGQPLIITITNDTVKTPWGSPGTPLKYETRVNPRASS